ncbi:hypothetical protein LCGC14_1494010 [marine sediment metagenome]|uniref:Uncharacterized protein n=1 Tax=marine sediment metagenome TaxID=412755 RepID=A0A0F9J6H2_9ZZZZ
MKPVTVHAATVSEVTERQREGLNLLATYLAKSLVPGLWLPGTARIVVEWGDEEELAKTKESMA